MNNLIIKHFLLIIIVILYASPIHAASIINEAFLKNINTDGDETSCAITGDRKYFIFARKPKEKENSDLYFSQFKNGKWSKAEPAVDLNSDSDDISPYISPDGKFILFASNRPGSLKNSSADKPSFDIYYSEKKEGGWEKPELLFGAVNTTDDELNPYITEKGNQLYFTRLQAADKSKSTIIKSYNKDDSWEDVSTAEISKNKDVDIYMFRKSTFHSGSYVTGFRKGEQKNRDVFYSDESESAISEITPVGEPINTPGDEISVSELSKDSIIISSNSNGIDGSYDLFIKKINDKIKVNISGETKNKSPEVLTLKIEAINYTNPDGIKIKILFFTSLKKNSWPLKTELKSPDSAGLIKITVDPGIKRVLILPGDSGMKSFSVEFLTKNKSITTSTIKIEPSMEKEFSAKPVYFNFNSSEIEFTDIPYLHELINYLRLNNDARLSLEGYSDGIGSYKSNIDISFRRAERIKDYIVKAGIKKKRIRTKGFGYIKDQDSGTSQNNRRVESNIITK